MIIVRALTEVASFTGVEGTRLFLSPQFKWATAIEIGCHGNINVCVPSYFILRVWVYVSLASASSPGSSRRCVCCVTICSWMCLDMNSHWQYLEEQPGHFVTLDGKVMGKHRGKHFNWYLSVCLSQRCSIFKCSYLICTLVYDSVFVSSCARMCVCHAQATISSPSASGQGWKGWQIPGL